MIYLFLGGVLLSLAFGSIGTVASVVAGPERLKELEPGIWAKLSVNPIGVKPWTWATMRRLRNVYTRFGLKLVITSLNDSHTTGKHVTGEALDARTVNLTPARRVELAQAVAQEFGAVEVYRGFYKGPGIEILNHPTAKDSLTVVPHLHLEFQA